MNKLKVFEVILQDDDIGMNCISFVDEPAIEKDFVYFNKNKSVMMQIKDKQEVVSPVLIPDQLIYRRNEQTEEEYYIKWTAETIEQVAIQFILNQATHNTSIMHPRFYNPDLTLEDCLVEDVYMKRMWIIENAQTDIANTKYGYELPEGTLMVHYKIFNSSLWNRIKSGELKGMSIEAFMSMKPIAQNKNKKIKNNKMNKKMSVLNKLITFLNEVSDEAEAIVDIAVDDATESGDVTLSFTLDSGDVVTVDAEGIVRDVNLEPLDEGSYLLEDGNYLVVDADSKFVETAEKELAADEATGEEAPIAQKKKTNVKQSKIRKSKIKQEDEISDAPVTFVVTVDGVDYEVEEAVFDYINKLEAEATSTDVEIEQFKTKVNKFKTELSQLKSRIPSAKPVPSVRSINQSITKIATVEDSIAANMSRIFKK